MTMSEKAKQARREYKAAWREKNKEKIKQYDAAYRKNNPDKIKVYNERYWERKSLKEGDSPEGKILRMFDQGMSIRSIAKELNMFPMQVKRVIDRIK